MDIEIIKRQIAGFEGTRHQVYDDATGEPLKPGMTLIGNPTIGCGRNLADPGLDKQEIRYLLENDIRKAVFDLLTIFPGWADLPETIQHILIDMRFNMGPGRFRSFENMIGAVKLRDWEGMKREMLDSEWAKEDVGRRAVELADMVDEIIKLEG